MKGDDTLDDLVRKVEQMVAGAADLAATDLDAATRQHVGLVLADTVGVIAAGARAPQMVAVAADPASGTSETGAARALVPGTRRGDPLTVAWLNGTAGTFLELDEGYRPTGHPAVHIIPAALAVAEADGASGEELVRAIVAGYEVTARLHESFRLPQAMHPHGHVGALGAATAVSLLRREDPVAAVRIAATQPLLTGWDACYDGASARNTWSGHTNRIGVLAPLLARAGFTGSLASHLGPIAPYVAPRAVGLDEPVTPTTLRIRRNYFKFHSACALTHAALDATLKIRARLSSPVEARDVEVVTVTNNLRIARQARPNNLSTRFSLPYAIAAALVTGSTGPEAFAWRSEIAELAARVRVASDPALDERWPAEAPATVRVTTPTESVEMTVDNPHGHHSDPATVTELRAKFIALGGTGSTFDALSRVSDLANCATVPLDVHPHSEGMVTTTNAM